jgi:hypothetical protein
MTPESIYAPDLLLHEARAPLGMQQHHDAAGAMEIQTFSADQLPIKGKRPCRGRYNHVPADGYFFKPEPLELAAKPA